MRSLTLTKRNTSDDCWWLARYYGCLERGFAPFQRQIRLSRLAQSNQILILGDKPSSTSLNCANLEPPGRPPCCILADMFEDGNEVYYRAA